MSPEAPLVLAAEFRPGTAAEWRAAVDRVLAGRDTDLSAEELDRRFERRLVTTTYDGLAVQPLYTRSDVPTEAPAAGVPGSWPYVRGATLLGGVRGGWDVRQPVDLSEVAARGARPALDHLERGATSILLRPGSRPPGSQRPGSQRPGSQRPGPAGGSPAVGPTADPAVDVDLLDAALDGVYLDLAAVALDSAFEPQAAEALLALWQRRQVDPAEAAGVLGLDPIGDAASRGISLDPAEAEVAVALAAVSADRWPRVRSWVVDATRYHEAGASDAEELACATATGIAYLRLLTGGGLDVAQAFGQLEFRLSATADQFGTTAKLRAARRLWARVAEVLGVPGAGGQRQHVLTSRAMLTRYDPWVNLLRNTTACFAAGVGGADAITVEPHDLLVDPAGPTDLGRRMARNTHLLLLEETHLARVIDPGGGSWYVESLTDALARQAWAWVREIEAAGGMAAALDAGLVQDRIAATWDRRAAHLARRTDILVGVSDFPNLDDRVPPAGAGPAGVPAGAAAPASAAPASAVAAGVAAGGLPRRRYAEAFEALRARTDEYERAHDARPVVLLVRLGSAADFTARATYAKSFFETAGLRTVTADVTGTADADGPAGPDEVRRWIAESGARLACLCSSDPVYAEQGPAVAGAVAAAGLSRTYAATRPGPSGDPLLAAGADELVYAGCDVLDALTRALEVVGVP
ncbi:MAG TPA: methylmalonyl-CoA mutase subunit beta [Acidimicrobiales bacterium]|nr:methylmalonyl-CoA mutase subunit beta [Acidimicrobiales bacterium]